MYTQALALVTTLTEDGDNLRATTDPVYAAANRPCVLVTPPAINWQTRAATWTLVALSAENTGNDKAWQQLDDLVAKVAAVLDVENARPAAYALAPGTAPVPAFLITYTTSH